MLTKENDKLHLDTPYNKEFVEALKEVIRYTYRNWDSTKKCWVVSAKHEKAVADLLKLYYNFELGSTPMRIMLIAKKDIEELGSIQLAGKMLIYANSAKSGGFLASGVTMISGEISSGGGDAYTAIIQKGSIFEVVVPERAIELISTEAWDVIVLGKPKPDRKALEDERAKLLSRIREIDEILQTHTFVDKFVEFTYF